MVRIETRDLHLAAYMKANGASFVGYENRAFCFLSEKSAMDWKVEHANSCCRRVDKELIDLRKLMK